MRKETDGYSDILLLLRKSVFTALEFQQRSIGLRQRQDGWQAIPDFISFCKGLISDCHLDTEYAVAGYQRRLSMCKILILYYSMYGHIEIMAKAVAEGARGVEGAEVSIKRVPELMPEDVARKAGAKLNQAAPVATVDE
jgi:hypothetical protein